MSTPNIVKSLQGVFGPLFSLGQWQLFLRALSRKEKVLFGFFFSAFVASSLFLSTSFYLTHTEERPVDSGVFTEGMIGQPRFINPLLASSDIDRDLMELVFAGLMTYNEKGEIVPDLAVGYEVKDENRIYEVELRKEAFWHDGQQITADDVVFTIKSIQDPEFKSPERINWIGVQIEKVSDFKIAFRLDNPYLPFPERLTVKILPRHIFEQVLAENLPFSPFNLQPIGSGPWRFKEMGSNRSGEIQSIGFVRNKNYFGSPPYLQEVRVRFFTNEESAIAAAVKGQVQGLVSPIFTKPVNLTASGFIDYRASLPRYFAVFFNPEKSSLLIKKDVREALGLAINKEALLKKVLPGQGKIVHSPILPDIFGLNPPLRVLIYDPEKAAELFKQAGFEERDGRLVQVKRKEVFRFEATLQEGQRGLRVQALQTCLSRFPDIYPEAKITGYFGPATKKAIIRFQEKYKESVLDPGGFKEGTGIVSKATREKLNEVCNQDQEIITPFKLSLVTVDQTLLKATAEELKEQWKKLGLDVEVTALEFNQLMTDYIKPRNYEMLLFGQALNLIPDPLPFWHSSRVKDPGLNLAFYKNERADGLLKEIRQAKGFEETKPLLEEFQNTLLEDLPALFLYSPDFQYWARKEVRGINLAILVDPSKRFLGMKDWYLKTQRVWR